MCRSHDFLDVEKGNAEAAVEGVMMGIETHRFVMFRLYTHESYLTDIVSLH